MSGDPVLYKSPDDRFFPAPAILAFVVFVVALWAQQTTAFAGVFGASGENLVLAKSLATGEGMRWMHLPSAPDAGVYAPLYPFVLSLLWRIWPTFPDNLMLIQIFDSATLSGATWVIVVVASRFPIPRGVTLGALMLGFVNIAVLSDVTGHFADSLFLVCFSVSVFLADRRQMNVGCAAAAGVCAAATTLAHPSGWGVAVGVVAGLLVRSESRAAVAAATGSLVILLPWALWLIESTGVAVGPFAKAMPELIPSAELVPGIEDLVRLLVGGMPPWFGWIVVPVISLLVVWGMLSLVKGWPALVLSLVGYTVVESVGAGSGASSGLIMVPWFAVLLAVGSLRLWRFSKGSRILVVAFTSLLLVVYLPRATDDLSKRRFAEELLIQTEPLRPIVRGVNAELPDNAVIASTSAIVLHLYTARKSVPLGVTEEHSPVTTNLLCQVGVTHVALDNRTTAGQQIRSALGDSTDALVPLFEFSAGPSLYELRCLN